MPAMPMDGFQFDSHLADFFFFTFYQAYVLPLWVGVRLW